MTVQAWDETGRLPAALVDEYPWPMLWQDEIERELGMTMDFAFSKLAMIGQRVTELRIEAGLSAEPEPEMPAVAGATYDEINGWSEIHDFYAGIHASLAGTQPMEIPVSGTRTVSEQRAMRKMVGGWTPRVPVPTLRERLMTSLLGVLR
jgi:hypothetical protein